LKNITDCWNEIGTFYGTPIGNGEEHKYAVVTGKASGDRERQLNEDYKIVDIDFPELQAYLLSLVNKYACDCPNGEMDNTSNRAAEPGEDFMIPILDGHYWYDSLIYDPRSQQRKWNVQTSVSGGQEDGTLYLILVFFAIANEQALETLKQDDTWELLYEKRVALAPVDSWFKTPDTVCDKIAHEIKTLNQMIEQALATDDDLEETLTQHKYYTGQTQNAKTPPILVPLSNNATRGQKRKQL
jgi:hypothetical protein